MQVHQKLSVLFYRKRKKQDKQGYIPIYCRLTIDGIEDEISTGIKVLDDQWDDQRKEVLDNHPFCKKFNKTLSQTKTDLERHFDLVVAKNGTARPQEVFHSYRAPATAIQQKNEKRENIEFSLDLDQLIKAVIKYQRQVENLEKEMLHKEVKQQRLDKEKEELLNELEQVVKKARTLFDNKSRLKTLVMAIDEYLLNFLEYVMAGERACNTLIKRWGAKKRLLEFMQQRYKWEDVALAELEYKFITEFIKFNQIDYGNDQNTLWKYAQILQEIMNRATANAWVPSNIFGNYQCRYLEPDDKKWPSIEEMNHLIHFEFKEKELSDIRYIFVFQSFSGPSYAELYALKSIHLIRGIDGKIWTDQRRRKTKSPESLPLLPICLDILEKFKDDPRCLRSGKVLPVPTDQYYNRCLKIIGETTGIRCLNNSHQARYFFANEIAHRSGVETKTIAKLLGQKSARSVETYLKPTTRLVSETMQMVEEKLFAQEGSIFGKKKSANTGGKVIPIKPKRVRI